MLSISAIIVFLPILAIIALLIRVTIGKPILIGVEGAAAKLIEKADCGLSCIPENPSSIAQAVKKLFNMSKTDLKKMGNAGKKFYNNKLSLRVGAKKFEKIFVQIGKTSSNR